MGMSVDGYYKPNDVKEVSKAGTEKESKIADVANQPVDKDTLRHIEGMRNFFENNKDVANQFKRNRDKLFTSEYSTNDADLRFKERLEHVEDGLKKIQQQLEKGLNSGIEQKFGDPEWNIIFPPKKIFRNPLDPA